MSVCKRISVAIACWLAMLAHSAPVMAQRSEDTGAAFYRACKAEVGKVNGRCEVYLEGVADMLAAFGNGGHPGGICGSRYGNGELSRIFVRWMPRNRSFWSLPRAAGAAMALRGSWPCPSEKGRRL